MKRLLVIDQGQIESFDIMLERAIELGYSLTLLTEYRSIVRRKYYDKVHCIRFSNWPKIEKVLKQDHKENAFEGVLGLVENSTHIANKISAMLGLDKLSKNHSDSFKYKDRMRVALEACGLNVPRYMILNRKKDMYKLCDFNYPIVLKPSSYSGSLGVVKVNEFKELYNKINIPYSVAHEINFHGELISLEDMYGLSNIVLAEEYIGGKEYSVDGVVIDGEYKMLGGVEKFITSEPYFYEIGHIFPTDDFENKEVQEELAKAHKALGFENAYTHTEFKICEGRIYIIEIGARMGGDHIPKLMNNSLDFNVVDLAIKSRTGELKSEDVDYKKNKKYTGILFINSNDEWIGKKVKSIEIKNSNINILETKNYYEKDEIYNVEDWYEVRIGHVMFETESYKDAQEFVNNKDEYLKVIID